MTRHLRVTYTIDYEIQEHEGDLPAPGVSDEFDDYLLTTLLDEAPGQRSICAGWGDDEVIFDLVPDAWKVEAEGYGDITTGRAIGGGSSAASDV